MDNRLCFFFSESATTLMGLHETALTQSIVCLPFHPLTACLLSTVSAWQTASFSQPTSSPTCLTAFSMANDLSAWLMSVCLSYYLPGPAWLPFSLLAMHLSAHLADCLLAYLFCLSNELSVFLSDDLSICLCMASLTVYVIACLSVNIMVCLYVYLIACLSHCLCNSLSVCLCNGLYACLCKGLSAYLYNGLYVCPFWCPPVCLFI
jgi:hypothetical protein